MFLKKVKLRVSDRRIPYGIPSGMTLKNPDDVYRAFRFLSERVQEEVYAVYLDVKLRVIGVYQVAKGSMLEAHFDPADVLRPALLIGASKIIIVHNHPSGDSEPSNEDRILSQRMREACLLIGLSLEDSLVIGRNGYSRY